MPNINVVDMAGKVVGEIALSEKVFGKKVNEAILHTAVRAYLMNQRQGTQSTLTRSEVSGGGRKPWKQKGTGHARQGSTRSPQWTHGGIALGPKPRSYRINLNKSIKKNALFGALSAKVANGEMIVVDQITATEYKTKAMVNMIDALTKESVQIAKTLKTYQKASEATDDDKKTKKYFVAAEETTMVKRDVEKNILIVLPEVNSFVVKSCANIEGVKTTQWNTINVYDLLNSAAVIFDKNAVAKIEEVYAR